MAQDKKYLSLTGLKSYDGKIKSLMDQKDTKILKIMMLLVLRLQK